MSISHKESQYLTSLYHSYLIAKWYNQNRQFPSEFHRGFDSGYISGLKSAIDEFRTIFQQGMESWEVNS
jgi:hypothetical protein